MQNTHGVSPRDNVSGQTMWPFQKKILAVRPLFSTSSSFSSPAAGLLSDFSYPALGCRRRRQSRAWTHVAFRGLDDLMRDSRSPNSSTQTGFFRAAPPPFTVPAVAIARTRVCEHSHTGSGTGKGVSWAEKKEPPLFIRQIHTHTHTQSAR